MTKLDDRTYSRAMYQELLRQYSERKLDRRLRFTKIEKDILVVLLQRVKPNLELKWIRKLVFLDLKRITDEAWKTLAERY